MLSSVYIKKFLYLENINIELSDGLNVFTGETGVGKSLIIDAIEFVIGKKSNISDNDYVELVFENVSNEFSEDGTVIVARQIKSGKSQYFLNGKRATLSTIKEAIKNIIEIHGQHSQQSLFNKDYQRDVLDSFSNLGSLLEEYDNLYKKYKKLKEEYSNLLQQQSNRLKEIDIIKFQLEELENADIKEGEKQSLEDRYEYLSSLKDIKISTEEAKYKLFEKEFSIEEELSSILKSLEKFTHISEEINQAYSYLDEAKTLIQEAFYSLSSLDFEYETEELQNIEERLNLINHLEMKYKTDEKGLIELKKQLREKLDYMDNLDIEIPKIKNELDATYKELLELANKISEIRKENAKKLEKIVENHLKELALSSAKFVVEIKEREINRYGKDSIQFLFSANEGYEPTVLEKTASGGELSRISLALKLISNKSSETIVFDEIDTGIGGKTAVFMAEKIKKLSKNFQVILITHLPQIAVFADRHFVVEKKTENGKTTALLKQVEGNEKQIEIARMISGIVNDKSIKYAKELIEQFNGI